MLHFAERVAPSSEPVLLLGETGCGKTYLAGLIHEMSSRFGGPFIRVNCAAVPEGLFEREMFGHVRGSFTDAKDSREGLFEAANGGTIFLDEVGEVPLQLQSKLLAVLEERCIRRIGATADIYLDVRVIAATNADLQDLVGAGRFRRDLFHRLAVLIYNLPPLRERRPELRSIVEHLLRRANPHSPLVRFTPEAWSALRDYTWPGNIRELDNALRRALVFSDGGMIELHHLPDEVRQRDAVEPDAPRSSARSAAHFYAAPVDPAEEIETICQALDDEEGNRTRAARRLGMARSTLWAKMNQYRIEYRSEGGATSPFPSV